MKGFLKEIIEGRQFELTIDKNIFSKDIVLKSALSFLDQGYFFFRLNDSADIVLQFTVKPGIDKEPASIIGDFSDTLLETTLRDKLEKDNKVIREAIVLKAINGPLDQENFVTLDTDETKKQEEENNQNNESQNQINFEKDIDEILKEIENDPELKIDEEEIESILKEIEEESGADEDTKPNIKVDLEGLKSAKQNFKK